MLKKLITEPLIHFLFFSGVIFFIYDYTNKQGSDIYTITVSESRIEQLKNDIKNTKQRSPVEQEVTIAIESYTLNEAYLREARELGLNEGDQVINRRLRQKMEYLLDEMGSIQEPTANQLAQFYQSNIERYQQPITYSFSQVYVSTDRSQEALMKHLDAQQILIDQGKTPMADFNMLPKQIVNQSAQQIELQFGRFFVIKIESLPLRKWSSPIDSGIGKHFVFISEKSTPKAIPLEQVKSELINDWQYEQRKTFKQAYESELMKRYTVDVFMPNINEAQ